jgi:hypothetical protein
MAIFWNFSYRRLAINGFLTHIICWLFITASLSRIVIITIVSATFGLGAFVVGIFGMNFQWSGGFLEKRNEEDKRGQNLFIVTVSVTVGAVFVGAALVILLLKSRFPKLLSLE